MEFLTVSNRNPNINGPLIEVIIFLPQPISQQLKREGKQIPAFKATALIDTGATATCITYEIVEKLGLNSFDVQDVYTAAGESQQLLYGIGVGLPVSQPNLLAVQALCADLSSQHFYVLIGRDILSVCTLFYNWKDNSFVLHY